MPHSGCQGSQSQSGGSACIAASKHSSGISNPPLAPAYSPQCTLRTNRHTVGLRMRLVPFPGIARAQVCTVSAYHCTVYTANCIILLNSSLYCIGCLRSFLQRVSAGQGNHWDLVRYSGKLLTLQCMYSN